MRRQEAGRCAEPDTDGVDGARLKRAEGVDDKALGAAEVGDTPRKALYAASSRSMSGFEAVHCREQGESRHMHELLAHVSKAGGAPRVQHRKVQENGQSLGTSCEEAVGGDAELRGDIHGDTAEEVHHQDGRGGAIQEVTEL